MYPPSLITFIMISVNKEAPVDKDQIQVITPAIALAEAGPLSSIRYFFSPSPRGNTRGSPTTNN